MKTLLALHGVNLNMLGRRDPAVYGTVTLEAINTRMARLAEELGFNIEFFQSNHEGAFVERIHAAHDGGVDGVIVNAGAWTHYSYAVMDALGMLTVPVVEVHLSHVQGREAFRRVSVLSDVACGVIAGFGAESYLLAVRALAELLKGQ